MDILTASTNVSTSPATDRRDNPAEAVEQGLLPMLHRIALLVPGLALLTLWLRSRVGGREEREDGYSVVEWIMIIGVMVVIVGALAAIIVPKLRDAANGIDLTTPQG